MSDFGNAIASEVANGKTFTSAAGLKVTGTGEMASDLADELATQDSLIAQIATALEGKTGASGEDLSAEMTAQDEAIASQDNLIAQIATALEGKTGASGGTAKQTVTCNVNYSGGIVNYSNDGLLEEITESGVYEVHGGLFFYWEGDAQITVTSSKHYTCGLLDSGINTMYFLTVYDDEAVVTISE
jgi:hypothetical protein